MSQDSELSSELKLDRYFDETLPKKLSFLQKSPKSANPASKKMWLNALKELTGSASTQLLRKSSPKKAVAEMREVEDLIMKTEDIMFLEKERQNTKGCERCRDNEETHSQN